MPTPNANVSSATRKSDETTLPKPARRSRLAYSLACENTSTMTSATNGSHSRSASQSTPQRIGVFP